MEVYLLPDRIMAPIPMNSVPVLRWFWKGTQLLNSNDLVCHGTSKRERGHRILSESLTLVECHTHGV